LGKFHQLRSVSSMKKKITEVCRKLNPFTTLWRIFLVKIVLLERENSRWEMLIAGVMRYDFRIREMEEYHDVDSRKTTEFSVQWQDSP
jgi:hypothetical protein